MTVEEVEKWLQPNLGYERIGASKPVQVSTDAIGPDIV
jgi:hypothetical protein